MIISGEINITQVLEEVRRERLSRQAWQARLARDELRREEAAALRAWWQAPEGDRAASVRRHRAVFCSDQGQPAPGGAPLL